MTIRLATATILILTLAALGCGGDDAADTRAADRPQAATTSGDAATGETGAGQGAAGSRSGTVTETMDSGGYTYAAVDCDGEILWAAGPQTELAVGDAVTIETGMPMRGFHAESLDRTFDVIHFTSGFGGQTAAGHGGMTGMSGMSGMSGEPGAGGMGGDSSPSGHGGMTGGHPQIEPGADLDLAGITPAEGGKTVAAVWAERQDLAGQEVTIRGRVVKYSPEIMGKNWLHLQDGTGDADAGTHDLTVTTGGFAKVGDLVTVTGTVTVDRDLGMGYQYGVLIEQAEVVKE
jgi:hypothetical protein